MLLVAAMAMFFSFFSGPVLAGNNSEGSDILRIERQHGEGADFVPVLPATHGEGDDGSSLIWTLRSYEEGADSTGGGHSDASRPDNGGGHGDSGDRNPRNCTYFSITFAEYDPIGFYVCGDDEITITISGGVVRVVSSKEIARFPLGPKRDANGG